MDIERLRTRRPLLAVLLVGQFMANMDITITNVAVPSIQRTLHASPIATELVAAGYVAAYASLFIVVAKLGKVLGYGRMFVAGVAGFTVASLACALAQSAGVLVAARVFQGAFAAVLVAQVLSGIQLTFTGAERARVFGTWGVTLSLAAVAGQLVGGALITADVLGSSWRAVFLLNVPIGVVLLICAARVLPLEPGAAHGRRLWPLVDRAVLSNRVVVCGLGGYGTSLSIYFSLLFIIALYLQHGHGRTALYSGLTMLSWVSAFGVAGFVWPRLLGARVVALAPYGALLIAAATGALGASLWTGTLSEPVLVVLLGLGGFGLGTISNATMTGVTGALPKQYAPDLSGLTGTNVPVAGTLGVAVFGTAYLALAPRLGVDRAFASVAAAHAATALLAAYAALKAVRAMRLRPARDLDTPRTEPSHPSQTSSSDSARAS